MKNIVKQLNENFYELDIMYNNDNNKKYNTIAYDGTTNNRIQKGILNTDQNLIGYDVNYNVLLTLTNNDFLTYNNRNNNSNKNSEITMFINYLKNNTEQCKNNIYIGDRLYSVYELFNIINNNNGKYIFRLKGNLDIFNDEILNKKDKNYKIKCDIKNNQNIKLIKYTQETTKKIVSKTNEIKIYNISSTIFLLTNLANYKDFSDELIINLKNFI